MNTPSFPLFLQPSHSELPPTALGKNLWRTNNLEQFRARATAQGSNGPVGDEATKGEDPVEGGVASYAYPKVLITVRSELLSGTPGYRSHFLPFESQNQDKNAEHEVIKYFQELRFVPFGDKREKYMSQVGERLMVVLSK